MKFKICIVFFFVISQNYAQDVPLRVVTKDIPNRLAFYVENENEQDFDVQIKISGTNFRQSQGRPRWIRVPGATKVHLKTIVLTRGKKPNYKYDLLVNDSLSKRALKKESERIKIRPKKSITVYITESCLTCDSIISPLDASNYKYAKHVLNDNPNIIKQLKAYLPKPIDSIKTPILNIGGRLFTEIENYDGLLKELNKN